MPSMTYIYQYAHDAPLAQVYYSEWLVQRIIDTLIGVVLFLLALRLILVFLGADAGNSFMQWLYGMTGQLIAPFANIFSAWDIGGFILEWTTVFAMLAYAILGWLIAWVITFFVTMFRSTI